MRKKATVLAALLLHTPLLLAQAPSGLVYSGETAWDSTAGMLTFKSCGSMPESREGFYWRVPAAVKTIVIESNVTVRGGFRVPFRGPDGPLRILGRDRKTSVILGTDEEQWTARNNVAENDKWKYGAVNVLADATVIVSNLTSRNPRAYHISGYANKSVLHLSQCDLLDSRPGPNNNSDGFIGAAGSTISDCLISTGDDAIKVYHDITIRNVTIEQHRNGAPIQFGWGGENGRVKAIIEGLTIKGVSRNGCYNMAPIAWVSGRNGCCEATIRGLKVAIAGQLYDPAMNRWAPIGLFDLRPASCTLNLTVIGADIGGLGWGTRKTRGRIIVNGETLEQ
jgi:hypothetical protein